jgi:glycosyltransferase involved in cell wall biosynthesis
MKNCVVIPVYNSPYIDEVIQDALKYNYTLVVVDDGSDSKIKVKDNVTLVTHHKNMGKGEAIISGAKKAKELGFEYFVTMDADKQHLASEIDKLIQAYEPNSIVIGNRDFEHDNVPKSSKFGRKFSNFWVKLETFKTLGDTQSGFRLYPVSILDLNIKNKRFDFEIEVLALHSYKGCNIIDVETACYYPPRNERVTHFDKVKDNIRLSLIHTKLVFQRYILLRGFLWK